MTQEKSKPQDQPAADVTHDPTLNKDAADDVMAKYEERDRSDETKELQASTEKELGKVEQALEDVTMGIEDAS